MTGAQLQRLREDLELDQATIAGAFGADQSAWSRWENGTRAIPDLVARCASDRILLRRLLKLQGVKLRRS